MATSSNAEATAAWDGPLFDRFVQFRPIVTTGLSNHGEKALSLHPPPVGASVLDVGCGFGDATERTAGLIGSTGPPPRLDGAPRFIESCKADVKGANASFSGADVQFEDLGGPYD